MADSIDTLTHVDNLVIGAGAAGGQIAMQLAEAGQQVLILEAGPARTVTDMVSSQIWARRLKWAGAEVIESGDHTISHTFNAGYGTGGSAAHHYGVWLRLHEGDFRVHSDHGISLDWPIQYRDLQPWYDRLQQQMTLSGDAQQEIWRPAGEPYPNPPLPIFSQGRVMERAFKASGLHTSPIPLAINSVPRGDRAACQYDGWCDAGCPIGALANPLVTTLPRATRAGARIINDATVLRVLRNPSRPEQITGVEYVHNGEPRTLSAGRVIVAAFTVQSTRILLNSATDEAPAPGNRYDQLGRYLCTHPAGTVFGMFDDETLPHQGVSGGQLLCHDFYDDKASHGEVFGSYQWLIANASKPNDLLSYTTSRADVIGEALAPWLQRAARHLANMTLVCEDISSPDNRITLSDRRDTFGVPLAHTHHDIHPKSAALWQQAIAKGRDILAAGGATETWNGPRAAMHILGGTVMGQHEHHSVTDQYGRVHDTENLYVAGTSLFPTSGAVNPTFTLSALAARTADHLGAPLRLA